MTSDSYSWKETLQTLYTPCLLDFTLAGYDKAIRYNKNKSKKQGDIFMKKLICVILTLVMALSLVACGNKEASAPLRPPA